MVLQWVSYCNNIALIKGVQKKLHFDFCFSHISACVYRIFGICVPAPHSIPLIIMWGRDRSDVKKLRYEQNKNPKRFFCTPFYWILKSKVLTGSALIVLLSTPWCSTLGQGWVWSSASPAPSWSSTTSCTGPRTPGWGCLWGCSWVSLLVRLWGL